MVNAKNTISNSYDGNLTLEANNNRSYFFIVMTGGTGTIAFGGGDGEIPLTDGAHYAPPVCPTGQIVVTATGSYVIHMG